MQRIQRILVYLVVLSFGLVVSAMMGMEDATASPGGGGGAQLNTSRLRLRDGGGDAVGPPADARYEQAYAQQKIFLATRSLVPMAETLAEPRRGEWRNRVREPDQDFGQFASAPRRDRGVLLLQPIGKLPKDQERAMRHMLEAMSAYFGMPAHIAEPLPIWDIPEHCFRITDNRRQINAEALMETVLSKKVSGTVASVIALTGEDLYPGERWPFESAYGWSSFESGTAVLSTHAILSKEQADRGQNLLRLCKLAVHELTHTFNLKHCSKYLCLMNGCSDLAESDAKPFVLCPDCLAKLSLASERPPSDHLQDMLDLCKAKGFSAEARTYLKSLRMLK